MSHLPRPTPEEINYGAETVSTTVATTKPFFIGRNGTVELETLFFWYIHRRLAAPTRKPYPPQLKATMARNAGVWPATDESMDAWATDYAAALKAIDGLAAGWYEPYRNVEGSLLAALAPTAFTVPLRSLEPYYVEPSKRWTAGLAGKTVAVVSSFADSITKQLDMPDASVKIWGSVAEPATLMPPTTAWRAVRTYYSPSVATDGIAGWPPAVRDWSEAVDWTVRRVQATGATVAIIGCGGLGMLVGAKLRAAGISAFVLGGATQVLFGIRGARWATHPVISAFWNRWWVWPTREETPSGALQVEGGCYWSSAAPTKIDKEESLDGYQTAEE